ncbi:MAG: hypothetical protein WCT20_02190 [Candidatus Babeliales bacterium]
MHYQNKIASILFFAVGGFCSAAMKNPQQNSPEREKIRAYVSSLKLKKDSYRRARGGSAAIYEITCAKCNAVTMYYQKDGAGKLLRCYLDRIMYPESLERLAEIRTKKDMPNLVCSACTQLIGIPMVYTKDHENRLAFRMIYGCFSTNTIKGE